MNTSNIISKLCIPIDLNTVYQSIDNTKAITVKHITKKQKPSCVENRKKNKVGSEIRMHNAYGTCICGYKLKRSFDNRNCLSTVQCPWFHIDFTNVTHVGCCRVCASNMQTYKL